jgi:DNA polymerase epsilon subunit 1
MGLPIELDTDGIWCMLPKSFPENFFIKTKKGKKLKLEYPLWVLNYRVHQKYTNDQYHEQDPDTGEWKVRDENSIFFELDGPYKAMVLPASTEEDKMLKKRYAVYEFDGSIAELKGFELKRRGELKLIQSFQTEIFPAFLEGTNRAEVYEAVGAVGNRWLDVITTKGKYLTDEEIFHYISEKKSMSKSVEDAGDYKSTAVTCAKRMAEIMGQSLLKDKGLSCHLVIACKPADRPTTERAIPCMIFETSEAVKKSYLRKWLGDPTHSDFDIRAIIDWDYYKTRLDTNINKLVTLPALNQKIPNPCPRVVVPDWMLTRCDGNRRARSS